MAAFVFDGTTNVTAAKADTVVLTANPATFTSAAESNGNVVLTFGSQTLTITGTTLAAGNLSGVTIPNGQFLYATTGATGTGVTGNTLAFLLGGSTTTTLNGTTASSVSAAFGGLGRADSLDNAETITITAGSKGSYLIYGNEGADSITSGNLESNTATTVFGGRGIDSINLGTQTGAGSNFAVYGGEGGDTINLNHQATTGNVTIFGDTAAADANGGNDTIILGTGNAGSSFNVFAAGGDDVITSDGLNTTLANRVATFADGTTATFFGGSGNDTISVGTDLAGTAKATITVYGGAGADSIYASNTGGTTTVYGGTGAADPNDGADNITVAGSGAFTVYANSGNDVVTATGLTAAATGTTTLSVFGGRGDDQITAGSTSVKANLALYGSENASDGGDVISAFNFKGGSTIIYGGTAAADATDGADSISFSGQGTTTIYAAGGNDSVSIKGLSSVGFADSVSTDTIFGGGGNDSITISGSQVTNGIHTVTLGDGADTFVLGSRDNSAANLAPTTAKVSDGNTTTVNEVYTVTFNDGITAGNTITVGGISFKSNVDLTANQVAAKFAGITAGTTAASLNATATDGVYSGTQQYGFSTSVTDNVVTTNGGLTNQADLTPAAYAVGAANGSGQTIEIKDFTLSQGDTLVVQNGTANPGTLQTVDASGAQTIQAALDLAVSGVNNTPLGAVSAVVFQGSTYVVVNNDANNTFNANTDLAIKLTGVNTLTGLAAATTIV